ncbi:MAG: RNA 3'-terminal phosphate cyclase [Candidatus Competibacteraceae bacterium]
MDLLTIDGSFGEGGGQIVRTGLSLALCTGRSIRISPIRPHRTKPGLRPQHLTAVQAAVQVSGGHAEGAAVGSLELEFYPGSVRPGAYTIAIGTAGSTSLVFQTLLPALLTAAAPSRLSLEGGTHNPLAPTFEFIQQAFLPVIDRMGPRVEAHLERYGFYPAGGGRWSAEIQPCQRLRPLTLLERGAVLECQAQALLARLPDHIAQRELQTVAALLAWEPSSLTSLRVASPGPGNCLNLMVRSEQITELFTGFGQRGVRAEQVARIVAEQVHDYLTAGVPVGEQLADQLLLPLALAGAGEFLTLRPSRHTLTNQAVIQQCLPVSFENEALTENVWRVRVGTGKAEKSAANLDLHPRRL